MQPTKEFVETSLIEKGKEFGINVTVDLAGRDNSYTYRSYDSDFNFLGSITIHFEESFASLVNYANREDTETYRYGKDIHRMMEKMHTELNLSEVTSEMLSKDGTSSTPSTQKPTEETNTTAMEARTSFAPIFDDLDDADFLDTEEI